MGTSTDALSGFVSDGWIGQPNIGLSPQKIQDLNRQADERIAAENKAKEEAKARKAAKKGKLPDLGSKSDDDYYQQQQAGDPVMREEDKKGKAFGWLKGLRKKL